MIDSWKRGHPDPERQQKIDAAATAMLRMTAEEVSLVKAAAWQIAKDSGMKSPDDAIIEAILRRAK